MQNVTFRATEVTKTRLVWANWSKKRIKLVFIVGVINMCTQTNSFISYQSCFGNLWRSKCYILQLVEYGEVLNLKIRCCLGFNKLRLCAYVIKTSVFLTCKNVHFLSLQPFSDGIFVVFLHFLCKKAFIFKVNLCKMFPVPAFFLSTPPNLNENVVSYLFT